MFDKYFDKIYVLTITGSKERRETFENNWKKINYEYFWGFEGKNLNYSELVKSKTYDQEASLKNEEVQRKMTLNEIACAMSHKAICKKMIDDNIEKALILEDDAVTLKENLFLLPQLMQQLPVDWDLLYLGYTPSTPKSYLWQSLKVYGIYPVLNAFKIKNYNLKTYRKTLAQNKINYSQKYSKNWKIAGRNLGAHAYAVTKKMAQLVVDMQTPVSRMSDTLFLELCVQQKIKAFEAVPKLITIRGNIPSTIRK